MASTQPVIPKRFPKAARIKSRKDIGLLFTEGKSLYEAPVKALYKIHTVAPGTIPVQIAVVVAKKNFKLAVDRNRIKRLLREAYRLQQPRLKASGRQYQIILMYTGKQLPNFNTVKEAVARLLQQIVKEDS